MGNELWANERGANAAKRTVVPCLPASSPPLLGAMPSAVEVLWPDVAPLTFTLPLQHVPKFQI
jgi:hypothetical protein